MKTVKDLDQPAHLRRAIMIFAVFRYYLCYMYSQMVSARLTGGHSTNKL